MCILHTATPPPPAPCLWQRHPSPIPQDVGVGGSTPFSTEGCAGADGGLSGCPTRSAARHIRSWGSRRYAMFGGSTCDTSGSHSRYRARIWEPPPPPHATSHRLQRVITW